MMLTERDRAIVAAVDDFGILSRVQVAHHLSFRSVTRVNAVLLRLTRHGYLTRRLQPTVRSTRRHTYTLGLRGAELLGLASGSGSSAARRRWQEASDLFVEHRLLVNDVRLAFVHASAPAYRLRCWKNEAQLHALNPSLVPDGYAEYELADKTYAVFLEADNGTETLGRWRDKVARYLDLAYSGRFQQLFARQFFRVLIVLPSVRRLENVQQEIARQTDRLFWLSTTSDLATSGPFAPIWRRPAMGPKLFPLTT